MVRMKNRIYRIPGNHPDDPFIILEIRIRRGKKSPNLSNPP
jgi:hypothetical protein